MSKQVNSTKPVVVPPTATVATVQAGAAPKAATGTIAVLKAGMPYRGARAAWYAVLTQYNGKPYAEFLAHVTTHRPSVYGPRSRMAGQPEPIPGWVGFFTRNGIVAVK
jgi:hypothetical protein